MSNEPAFSPASGRVRAEWLSRVEAEYRSAALAQHLTLWLIQVGAPPELVSDGLGVVADEMEHSKLSFSVYAAAGGEGRPNLIQESLQLQRLSSSLEEDLFLCNLRTFVLGETVAVRLFKRLRENCRVPGAREALDKILVDEVRHREFGWTVLHWMLASPRAERLRTLANELLPSALAELRRSYGGSAHDGLIEQGAVSSDDCAWGLMPLSEYRGAVEHCFKTDYHSRFAEVDIVLPV